MVSNDGGGGGVGRGADKVGYRAGSNQRHRTGGLGACKGKVRERPFWTSIDRIVSE